MKQPLQMSLSILAIVFMFQACSEQSLPNQSVQEDSNQSEQVVKQDEPTNAVQSMNVASEEKSEDKAVVVELSLEELMKRIENRSGKPLFVNFWASWCPPCRAEMPHIVELYEEYKNQVDFMAVSVDGFTQTKDDIPKAMEELEMNLPTFLLTADKQMEAIATIDERWEGNIPMTFVYNANGEKEKRMLGMHSKQNFKQAIESVLQNQS